MFQENIRLPALQLPEPYRWSFVRESPQHGSENPSVAGMSSKASSASAAPGGEIALHNHLVTMRARR